MKHASLLLTFCVLFGFSAIAQSTTTVEKNAKRITITTKKTDENGVTVTETYIAEGDEPAKILEGMAVNPEIIKRVEVINTNPNENGENKERLFLYRNAGDRVMVEGVLSDQMKDGNGEFERVIIIDKAHGDKAKECYKFATTHGDFHKKWVREESKINCAALGVLVHTSVEKPGSRISSLIENGGAKAAGLKEGDILTGLEEFDIHDYGTLHLALSHFRPGEVVTVRYDRDGSTHKAKVELKDWKELPGHEWRSRSDCAPDPVTKPITGESIQDDPSGGIAIMPLELHDAVIYPNPTDGIFSFSFKTDPGPLTVSITDVNGKVVYNENNENHDGSYKKDIDLKSIPQGNYVISVKQGDRVFTEQISKQ